MVIQLNKLIDRVTRHRSLNCPRCVNPPPPVASHALSSPNYDRDMHLACHRDTPWLCQSNLSKCISSMEVFARTDILSILTDIRSLAYSYSDDAPLPTNPSVNAITENENEGYVAIELRGLAHYLLDFLIPVFQEQRANLLRLYLVFVQMPYFKPHLFESRLFISIFRDIDIVGAIIRVTNCLDDDSNTLTPLLTASIPVYGRVISEDRANVLISFSIRSPDFSEHW